jgi:hypothetical protein
MSKDEIEEMKHEEMIEHQVNKNHSTHKKQTKSQSHPWAIFAFALVILGLAGGGGAYWYKKRR